MTTQLITDHAFHSCDEPALGRLAELVAFAVRPGDLITLTGDLGAGKTTFARAFLQALSAPNVIEVPSPTFTLVQTYQTARMPVAHFDLYRLNDPAELIELGLDDAIAHGAALVEWPDRGGTLLTGNTLAIALTETATNSESRDIVITADAAWAARLTRLISLHTFIAASGRSAAHIRYLQGDASVRRYARLVEANQPTVVVMDWPRQPDGPPIRDGKPYSQISHLAEGVRPFVGIGTALSNAGLSTPQLIAHDLDAGLLLIEDFGDQVFGASIDRAASQATLWQAGVDALVALRQSPPPAAVLPLPDGTAHVMPHYNHEALGIETELLLDWYWPACHATPVPADIRAAYTTLWTAIFDRLATLPQGWALRDYHSPNLLWLPDRAPPKNVGIIDFQDAQIGPHAYDLVSLLQDARVDVAPDLEQRLLASYCTQVATIDPAFHEASFRWSYAALGAQRNSKILGIFARLAHRDGKPHYLAHIPRIWRYLARDLAHPELADLSAWFDRAFPTATRNQPITPTRARPVPARVTA